MTTDPEDSGRRANPLLRLLDRLGDQLPPPADALARIRRMKDPPPFVHQPPLGQPIFGMVSCIEQTPCEEGVHPNGIWVFQFGGPSPEDPVGWVAADGTAGGLWLSGDR